jgi:hypothetical protein
LEAVLSKNTLRPLGVNETKDELQLGATLQAYDGSALVTRDLQHLFVESFVEFAVKLKTSAYHSFPLLSHLHYTLVIQTNVIVTI